MLELGNRFAIAGYLGEKATLSTVQSFQFAEEYAKQNERDFQEFMEAYRSGVLCEKMDAQSRKLL